MMPRIRIASSAPVRIRIRGSLHILDLTNYAKDQATAFQNLFIHIFSHFVISKSCGFLLVLPLPKLLSAYPCLLTAHTMSPPVPPSSPFQLTVHPFSSPTHDSCAYERGFSTAKNALVFIGGLTTGPHATSLAALAKMLEQSPLDYSLWEFRMRSSYSGFGYSSIANDVEDTAALVQYLRGIGKKKIVLMGASTGTRPPVSLTRRVPSSHTRRPGCQDCLEYTNRDKYQAPLVDGYILTSPVSDRESVVLFMSPEESAKSLQVAKEMIANGRENEPMPKQYLPFVFTTPVTAYRWNSLAAKGQDNPPPFSPSPSLPQNPPS